MAGTGMPPLSSSGVFTVADSILIDAPPEKVWKILLDFGSYKECVSVSDSSAERSRGQRLISASGAALADQTPKVGTKLLISPVHLPPTMGTPGFMQSHSVTVRVTTLDNENFRAAWVTANGLPAWVLHAERWQMLTVEGGQTKYETVEVYRGVGAYVVKFFTGKYLVLGVRAMAEGLKKRAESA
ncbi:hypothetical protein B0H15DRAFT_891017, partial [Mycena belliarum]